MGPGAHWPGLETTTDEYLSRVYVVLLWCSLMFTFCSCVYNDILIEHQWHTTDLWICHKWSSIIVVFCPANMHQVLSKSVHWRKSYLEKTSPKIISVDGLWYITGSIDSLRTLLCINGGQCIHWCTHRVWLKLWTFPSHDGLQVDIFQCKKIILNSLAVLVFHQQLPFPP